MFTSSADWRITNISTWIRPSKTRSIYSNSLKVRRTIPHWRSKANRLHLHKQSYESDLERRHQLRIGQYAGTIVQRIGYAYDRSRYDPQERPVSDPVRPRL